MDMICPFCGHDETKVQNSRPTGKGSQVWRRRSCTKCGEVFSTYETIRLSYLKVEKRDKKVVRYSRAKLYSSIYHCAVETRRSDRGAMGELAEKVTQMFEWELIFHKTRIVKTTQIVNTVAKILKKIDFGAYVRYLTYFKKVSRLRV